MICAEKEIDEVLEFHGEGGGVEVEDEGGRDEIGGSD